jgi:hypothetical protein
MIYRFVFFNIPFVLLTKARAMAVFLFGIICGKDSVKTNVGETFKTAMLTDVTITYSFESIL